MYRILDLITDRGSSGLGMIVSCAASQLSTDARIVDKIIIAQDSLKRFLNGISPGAYASLTKVDFKALDKFQIRPIGIYGSKEEIVRFLTLAGVVDEATYVVALPGIRSSSLTRR